ncbi:MAG: NfeD family protein [Candidatus Sericytochromatia bacterium]
MAWIWLLLSGGLLMTELLFSDMTALMLSLGALAAAGAAALGLGWGFQGIIFALASLATVLFLRPILRNWLQPAHSGLSTDGFVGCQAEVLEAISAQSRGRVKLYGEIWNASSYEAIGPGEAVIITGLHDNCLEVVPCYALTEQAREQLLERSQPEQLEGERK